MPILVLARRARDGMVPLEPIDPDESERQRNTIVLVVRRRGWLCKSL